MIKRILTIAESDSSGASGIQADLKTIQALGGYGACALTGITAQNSCGIQQFQLIDPLLIADQMRSVLDDIGVDAIKTGILNCSVTVEAVSDLIAQLVPAHVPVVVDPSLVTRDGAVLVDELTLAAIKRCLLIRAHVVTPNLREAECLTGMTLRDLDDMRHAAAMLRTLGAETVVLKCGQVTSGHEFHLVVHDGGEEIFEQPHVATPHTAGAGCTLASGIATGLAQGMPILLAVRRALDFLQKAMLHAPGYGAGAGPLNHAFAVLPEREEKNHGARP